MLAHWEIDCPDASRKHRKLMCSYHTLQSIAELKVKVSIKYLISDID